MDDSAGRLVDSTVAAVGHGVSLVTLVGAFIGVIPSFVALIAAIFYLIQLYESKTVQEWLNSRRIRKIARYKARIALLERAQRLQAAAVLANAIESSLSPQDDG